MNGRRSSIGMVRVPRIPNESRETTRSRNGSLRGAPASRWVVRWAARVAPRCRRGRARRRSSTRSSRAPAARRCASWCRGRAARRRCSRAPEVGDDVAAAEGVDRLLGVADQHQRGLADEGALDHLPLHRVGVLELVDHHDPPAPAHPVAGRGVVGLERDARAGTSRSSKPRMPSRRLRRSSSRDARRRRRRGVRRRSSRPAGRAGSSRVRGLRTTSWASSSAWARVSAGVSFTSPNRGGRGRRRSRRPARRGSRPG